MAYVPTLHSVVEILRHVQCESLRIMRAERLERGEQCIKMMRGGYRLLLHYPIKTGDH